MPAMWNLLISSYGSPPRGCELSKLKFDIKPTAVTVALGNTCNLVAGPKTLPWTNLCVAENSFAS